jgi:hypothetical protein
VNCDGWLIKQDKGFYAQGKMKLVHGMINVSTAAWTTGRVAG